MATTTFNNAVDINGALTVRNTVTSTGGFYGSLIGQAISASFALTASLARTASFAPNYLLLSNTSSMLAPYVLTSTTSSMLAPYVLTSSTSSMLAPYVLNSRTASFATTGSNRFNGNQTITGSLLNGTNVTATGFQGHAQGIQTIASGGYSHAEGSSTNANGLASHAEGINTLASGDYSHAEGYYVSAIGISSHAEGASTTTIGNYSHAEGAAVITNGDYSHAEGYYTITVGASSHAEGYYTTSSGDYSHAEGDNTKAIGYSSHAEGSNNITQGIASHAEGYLTTASGDYSHAEGVYTNASGSASHAEGTGTSARGDQSHAEGANTIASGSYSHAEGYGSIAVGAGSHTEGLGTITRGLYSHAEGENTITIGQASHAEGLGTIASGSNQTVIGKYNKQNNTSSLFIIGNGTDDNTRDDLALFNQNDITFKKALIVTGSTTLLGALNMSGYSINNPNSIDAASKIYIPNGASIPTPGISSYSDPITEMGTDGHFNGETIKGVAGETIQPGQLVYLYTDGNWYKANATPDGTAGARSATSLLGILVNPSAVNSTDNMVVLLQGNVYTSYIQGGDAPGSPLWVSINPGYMRDSAPNSSGNVVRQIGHVLTTHVIRFNPDNYYSIV